MMGQVLQLGVHFVRVTGHVIVRDPRLGCMEKQAVLWIGPFRTTSEKNKWLGAFTVAIQSHHHVRCEKVEDQLIPSMVAKRTRSDLPIMCPWETAASLAQHIVKKANKAV